MREFETGANRDDDTGKFDFEGYLSPAVLWEFARYMERHGHLADGSQRESDNWQKGIPSSAYMKSLLRHVMDLWLLWRGHNPVRPESGEPITWHDAFGGAMFNLQGLWKNHLDGRK